MSKHKDKFLRMTCDKKNNNNNLTSKRNLFHYFILPESSTEINSCDGTPVNQTATSPTQFKKKITPLRVFMRGKTMQERPNLYLSQAANKLPDAVNLDMFGTHLKVFWSHPQMGFLPLLQRFIFQLCSLPCGLNSAEHLGFKVLSLHYYRGCMC